MNKPILNLFIFVLGWLIIGGLFLINCRVLSASNINIYALKEAYSIENKLSGASVMEGAIKATANIAWSTGASLLNSAEDLLKWMVIKPVEKISSMPSVQNFVVKLLGIDK